MLSKHLVRSGDTVDIHNHPISHINIYSIYININININIVSGDTVDIHSNKFVCVLPAGGRDYPTHITSGTSLRQISDIRHDISFIKVR